MRRSRLDHRIVVGRGLRVSDHREAPPLVFHRGQFPKLEQG
jgi:hypothetical protein